MPTAGGDRNVTNWLGGATVAAGSNAVPIVVWQGTNSTQTNLTVFLPPASPQAFLYDANGNLTNDGQRAYFWDEENRLISVSSVSSVVKLRSEYSYDAQGRRIRKVDYSDWTGTAFATTNTTRFVWDGWLLISELITDNGSLITNSYVWGLDLSQSLQGAGGIGGLLASVTMTNDQSPMTVFYAFDGNGNVDAVVDGTGAVVARYAYDPFRPHRGPIGCLCGR